MNKGLRRGSNLHSDCTCLGIQDAPPVTISPLRVSRSFGKTSRDRSNHFKASTNQIYVVLECEDGCPVRCGLWTSLSYKAENLSAARSLNGNCERLFLPDPSHESPAP